MLVHPRKTFRVNDYSGVIKFRNFPRHPRPSLYRSSKSPRPEVRNTYAIDHARVNHFRIAIDQYLPLQITPARSYLQYKAIDPRGRAARIHECCFGYYVPFLIARILWWNVDCKIYRDAIQEIQENLFGYVLLHSRCYWYDNHYSFFEIILLILLAVRLIKTRNFRFFTTIRDWWIPSRAEAR